MPTEIILILSSGTLGIFLGAQLTEAVLIVPYWRSLSADEFFEFYKVNGKKIHQFYAPLTIAATFLPLSAVVLSFVHPSENQLLYAVMGISALLFFSTYFLYFKKANRDFADRSLSNEELPHELKRWNNWHWGRICFEFIAFGSSLLLLAN